MLKDDFGTWTSVLSPPSAAFPKSSHKEVCTARKECVCYANTGSSPCPARLLPLSSSHAELLELTAHTVLDLLPGSVPCTFFHSSAQLLFHICPQNHDHLYAALSGPEQWKLQFFQHQHYRKSEITWIPFSKRLFIWWWWRKWPMTAINSKQFLFLFGGRFFFGFILWWDQDHLDRARWLSLILYQIFEFLLTSWIFPLFSYNFKDCGWGSIQKIFKNYLKFLTKGILHWTYFWLPKEMPNIKHFNCLAHMVFPLPVLIVSHGLFVFFTFIP